MIDYKKFLKKDFTNKYKLLCPFSEFKIEKFAQVKNNNYICRIKIIYFCLHILAYVFYILEKTPRKEKILLSFSQLAVFFIRFYENSFFGSQLN